MELGNLLHTLIPLADFKAILRIDDREDALSRYCLLTATHTIEQYGKRRLLRQKRFEFLPIYTTPCRSSGRLRIFLSPFLFPPHWGLSGLKVHYRAGVRSGQGPG
jgi:hypothetical protein